MSVRYICVYVVRREEHRKENENESSGTHRVINRHCMNVCTHRLVCNTYKNWGSDHYALSSSVFSTTAYICCVILFSVNIDT